MADETVVAEREAPVVTDTAVAVEPAAAVEPVAAPVAEAPVAPVSEKPAAPAAPVPAVPDPQQQQAALMRQAYARQAEQLRQQQIQLRDKAVADDLAKFEQTLLATYAPEHVAPLVAQRRELYLQQFAMQDQAQDQAAKGQMIQVLATQFKAPPQFLGQFTDPAAMHMAAQFYAKDQEVSALKAEIAKLKQASVPPAPKGLPGTVSRGGETVTTDNIDALFNQGKVSASLYRNFLSTGQIK